MYFGTDSQPGKAEEEHCVVFTEHAGAAGGTQSTNTPGVWCTTELCLGVLYSGIGWILLTVRKKENSIVFVEQRKDTVPFVLLPLYTQ